MNNKGGVAKKSAWMIGAQASKYVLNLAYIAVVARLLIPDDFGIFALVAGALGVVTIIKDLGLPTVIVQKQIRDSKQLSGLFRISLAGGVLIGIISILIGLILRQSTGDARITNIAITMAIGTLISCLDTVPTGILRRDMRFECIALRDTVSAILSLTIGIAAAYAGLAYWALIIAMIVGQISTTIISWIVIEWRPAVISLDTWKSDKEHLKMGLGYSVSSLGGNLAHHVDAILIGKYLGTESLGYYSRAKAIMWAPFLMAIGPIGNVVISSISQVNPNVQALRKSFVISCILFGSLTPYLIYSAEEIVTLVLGINWNESIPIFQWMCLSLIWFPIGAFIYWNATAKGAVKMLIYWSWGETILSIVAIVIGASWGMHGVVISLALTGLLIKAPVVLLIGKKLKIFSNFPWFTLYGAIIITAIATYYTLERTTSLLLHNNSLQLGYLSLLAVKTTTWMSILGLGSALYYRKELVIKFQTRPR